MADYRSEFSDFGPVSYLDCAPVGPFPQRAVQKIHEAIQTGCHPERANETEHLELPHHVCGKLAALIGADSSEVVVGTTPAQGIATVSAALGLTAGDEVVVASSNLGPSLVAWLRLRRFGVRVFPVKSDGGPVRVQDVAAAFTSHTKVLAIDWVNSASGARADLAALGDLAHRRGALLVVDGTYGVGAVELNLRDLPVDVLVTAAWKYLLGPYGTAFLYVNWKIQDLLDFGMVRRSPAADAVHERPHANHLTVPAIQPLLDVPGSSSLLNLGALEGSLDFLEGVKVAAISDHCGRLLGRLAEGLRRQGYWFLAAAQPAHRSTILSFYADSPETTAALHGKLVANRVAVSLRQGMIRVSPHLYNDESSIDGLLELAANNAREPVAYSVSPE